MKPKTFLFLILTSNTFFFLACKEGKWFGKCSYEVVVELELAGKIEKKFE